jgi:5-hydroxyisourate hydrolase
MTRSPITTHVLDTTRGLPAAGMPITLEYQEPPGFAELGRGVTDADGRITNLLHPEHQLSPGRYRISLDSPAFFRANGT